jgi:regulator of protease activity HflC (stomatin/prohibitin superfamily)
MSFGKLSRVEPPGLRKCLSLWGLLEKVGPSIPTAEQVFPFDNESVFTSDGVKCLIDIMVCYRIVDVNKALFEVNNYLSAVQALVQSVMRNECGKLPARGILSSREQMADNIKSSIAKDCEPWGIAVRLVEIKNIEIAVQERK